MSVETGNTHLWTPECYRQVLIHHMCKYVSFQQQFIGTRVIDRCRCVPRLFLRIVRLQGAVEEHDVHGYKVLYETLEGWLV